MKILTLIVHAESEQSLADRLRGLEKISGFTFTRIESHGVQDERDPALSARDRVVGYSPRVRVDLMLKNEDIDEVLRTLAVADSGLSGRCLYWITPVEQHGGI